MDTFYSDDFYRDATGKARVIVPNGIEHITLSKKIIPIAAVLGEYNCGGFLFMNQYLSSLNPNIAAHSKQIEAALLLLILILPQVSIRVAGINLLFNLAKSKAASTGLTLLSQYLEKQANASTYGVYTHFLKIIINGINMIKNERFRKLLTSPSLIIGLVTTGAAGYYAKGQFDKYKQCKVELSDSIDRMLGETYMRQSQLDFQKETEAKQKETEAKRLQDKKEIDKKIDVLQNGAFKKIDQLKKENEEKDRIIKEQKKENEEKQKEIEQLLKKHSQTFIYKLQNHRQQMSYMSYQLSTRVIS